jgi:DNA-binding NarL/FixJ family response regulator
VDLSFINQDDLSLLKSKIIFTEDEMLILDAIPRGKSRQEIADIMQISICSVDRRIKRIKDKITRAGCIPCFKSNI